ncbi:MAG: hypothetical protein KY468_15710 [Armatimonadetes bacterium]|nr:hypothetical protein [Armatimonadota bacterium]
MQTLDRSDMQEKPENPGEDTLSQRFRDALDAVIEKVKEDRLILAAFLCGSLSYDEVWAKSDIDLMLVGTEEFKTSKDYCLTEEGVNIHVMIYPRSKFKSALEGSLQSSFFHSFFSRSTLLFTKDETLKEYYENVHRMGGRDREIQLLRAGTSVLPTLAKAEKWLHVKNDPAYSLKWLMYTVDSLATVEVVLNGEVTGREVVQQAIKYNPDFFHAIYTDLIHGPVNAETVGAAIDRINAYLDEKVFIFDPILTYLNDAGGIRSTTDMDAYFKKHAQTGCLSFAYEWLADKGIIEKVSTPLHLHEKSRVTVNEAAYYYDGGDFDGGKL